MITASSRLLSVVALAILLAACGGAEQRKARYLENGEKYFAARNFDKARVEFRNALQIAPNDANAHFEVGRVSEKLGNARDAAGQYQAAIELEPKHMQARAALARLYLLSGLADKAMELAEPGLTDDPENAQLLTVRAAARAQMGNTPEAFKDAEAAIRIAPGDDYAVALLASLYKQSARTDKAIEVVEAGLKLLPDSVDLRVVLADLLFGHERRDEAETQLKKVIDLQPTELGHRYRLARFYVLTKNIAGAESTMRAAIEAAPDNAEVKIALADLLVSQRGADQAEAELKKFAASEKDGAQLQLALAKFYESHEKADAAEAVYRSVIDKQGTRPDGLVARSRLAAVLVGKKQMEGAAKLIAEVLKENPRDNDALILRGNMALAKGDTPAAIADLRAVLRDQPNSIPVIRALARAHITNNETALAEETLHSAVQANPGDYNLRLELAQLFMQTGRSQQARPILEQLAKEKPAEAALLESVFRVQAAARDFVAARSTAESIQRVRPDLPLGSFLEGSLDELEKKPEAATAAYEKSLRIQPTAAEPLTALIRAELTRKRPDAAMARLDKVIAEQPANVVARNLKGELLAASGDVDAAVRTFSAAIEIAPQWWMPYRGLAMTQLKAKQTDAAIATLERGVEKTGADAIGADLASLYEQIGRSDDSIRVYEGMLKRSPRSLGAANNLAMLLVTYRKDQASLDRAQQLTSRFESATEPAILNTRGWVKFKRGEYQASLPLLQQAVDKSPESSLMRYHLGMAQWRTGNIAAARENLEVAITSGRNFNGVKEAQAALDEIKRAG